MLLDSYCSEGSSSGQRGSNAAQTAAAQASAAQRQEASAAAQRLSSAGPIASPSSGVTQHGSLLERAAAQQTQQAAAATAAEQTRQQLPRNTAARVASTLGNTLLLAGLGSAAFVVYYTYKYTPEELAVMADTSSKSEAVPDQV